MGKSNNGYFKAYNCSHVKNGLTLYKPESLAESIIYGRDNMPIWFIIYHFCIFSPQVISSRLKENFVEEICY